MSVIVTNAKNRISYNIVRSLGEKGIKVFSSDFVNTAMSFGSRHSKGHFIYPSPFRDQKGFIDCIIDNVNRLGAEVLIPVFEETFLISKHKKKIESCTNIVVPDYDQVLIAHNKDKWSVIAEKLGIPVPRVYAIEELRRSGAGPVKFPVLIKPKQGGGSWAISQVDSLCALEEVLANDTYQGLPWERFFIQEKIIGENHCVAMLLNKGDYRAKVAYKQLRDYPVTGGQATLRISIRNRQAEDCLLKLLESLNWHGVCQADFVVDSRTGVSYLIDLNPRFWGSLAQAIASGVDFPYLVYRMAMDGDVEPVTDFRTGVVSRWVGGDIRVLFSLIRNSKDRPGALRKFFSSAGAGPVFLDDFSLKDPLPFFIWSWDSFSRTLKSRSLQPVTHDSLEGVWE